MAHTRIYTTCPQSKDLATADYAGLDIVLFSAGNKSKTIWQTSGASSSSISASTDSPVFTNVKRILRRSIVVGKRIEIWE